MNEASENNGSMGGFGCQGSQPVRPGMTGGCNHFSGQCFENHKQLETMVRSKIKQIIEAFTNLTIIDEADNQRSAQSDVNGMIEFA